MTPEIVISLLIAIFILLAVAVTFLVISIRKEEKIMSTTAAALAALQQQVTQNTSVEESAVTLINGLAAQIAVLAGQGTVSSDDLTKLSASLQASAKDLAAAITANTAPLPVPAPTPGA